MQNVLLSCHQPLSGMKQDGADLNAKEWEEES